MERDFLKKTAKIWVLTNDHLCFGAQYNQINGNCLLSVQTSKMLSFIWKFWNITEKEMHFLDILFQWTNAPVQKSKIIDIFSRKQVEGTGMTSILSRSESYWKFMGNYEAKITKTDSFLGKFRSKSVWNLEWNWRTRRENSVWKGCTPSTRR